MYYFIDDEHKKNYEALMAQFDLQMFEDCQYESSIFIAAIPILHDLLPKSISTETSPLFELMEWDENEGKHLPSHPGLTGTSRRLLEVGLSLYNGYPIGLDDVLASVISQEYIEAIFQAIKIRAYRTFY
ncbi:hypothetical protein COL23_25735 [Priestia aryabhattai]|uniref:hypothetical protein n=1 Tax=Priestia aryabhattai TaxID=412384 RepID=UPI000BF7243E|nr:hypothetical protein [Priestia aryabhattai]PFW72155.1 hypothetical protein COL23_25735 [Priestia aryabhattai]